MNMPDNTKTARGAAFHWLCLAAILAVAAYFRVCNGPLSFFSLDSARDFQHAWRISAGADFPLLGAGQQQAFHLGPFYYYLTSLSFLFSDSLLGPYIQVGIADTLSVLLCYLFTRRYFGSGPALLASALYAVSFEAVFVGRYPGNSGYVHLIVIGYIWLLLRFLETNSRTWMIAAFILLGLSLQLHSAVLVLLPLTFLMVVQRYRWGAWKVLTVCVLLVLLTHLPLIVHEFLNGFENARSALALVHKELRPGANSGYLSRMAGALLLNPVAGAMLLPGSAVRPLQPLLVLQSLLVLFAAGAVIRGFRKEWWKGETRPAVALVLIWVLFPLFFYPLYPRANHNYIDVIHPGAMILIGAVIWALRSWVGKILAFAVLAAAGANLAFLVLMDEVHTRREGMIRLYQPSTVDLANLKGSELPLAESAPAGMQIRANERLMELLGSEKEVLRRFHGVGRLLFLDENRRFILSYLEGRAKRSGAASGDHFFALQTDNGRPQPGDIPLAGPWLLRRAVPCDGLIEDGSGRHTPTWATVDYGEYVLSIPRAVEIPPPQPSPGRGGTSDPREVGHAGTLGLRVLPAEGKNIKDFRYVILVSTASSASPPVRCKVDLYSSTSMTSVARDIDSLFFMRARILRVQCKPRCDEGIVVRIEGSPGERVDIDVYGEPVL